MRSSTSFAILALLASAGSSFGAPVPKTCPVAKRNDSSVAHADGATVPINAGNTDSVTVPITINANTGNADQADQTDSLPASLTNKKLKSRHVLRGLALSQPISEDTVDNVPPATGHSGVVNSKTVGGNDDALQGDKITLLPGTTSSGKTGVIDGTTNNYGAHVLQTPGTDETVADIQAGRKSTGNNGDVKVQLPTAESLTGAVGGGSTPLTAIESDASSGKSGNAVSQLLGKPGKSNGIAAQPLISAGTENNNPKPSSKPSPKPSQAQSSAAKSTQAQSSAAQPSASKSASQASASTSPKASASASSQAASSPSAVSHSASHSNAQPSASASSKPSQASQANTDYNGVGYGNTGDNGQTNGNPNDQNVGFYGPGSFDISKALKNGQNGSGTPTGPSRLGKQDSLQPAQTTFGSRPQNIVPCDGLFTHAAGDLVDMCIEMDLLSSAPEHTSICPDDMQHDIHAHLGPNDQSSLINKETMNAKASKDIAQFIRLCIDAGVL